MKKLKDALVTEKLAGVKNNKIYGDLQNFIDLYPSNEVLDLFWDFFSEDQLKQFHAYLKHKEIFE